MSGWGQRSNLTSSDRGKGWGRGRGKRKVKFVSPSNNRAKKRGNKASKYSRGLIKTELDRYDNKLLGDYQKTLDGGCFYLPNFICGTGDWTIFKKLEEDLKNCEEFGMIEWSKHSKHENPEFSSTFNDIIKKISEHFNMEVYQTRLNYYKNGEDWKPFHHDSHKYGDKEEDFTIGVSFGSTRALEFIHVASKNKFQFPQYNGDVFAFNKIVNDKFMHGVPKASPKVGPRFSVIAWGKKVEDPSTSLA